MSDEKLEPGADLPTPPGGPAKPDDADGNIADRPPNVTGGQPAVGEDLPRNTEF